MKNTNKHTATRKTQTGSTIEVTIERGTWDEKIYSDGWDTGSTKTHLVNSTRIVLRDKAGKQIANGDAVSTITPKLYGNHKELTAKGAVARVGDAFIGQGTLDLVNEAIAEADAATSRTSRQVEIETAEAKKKAKVEAWKNSPEGKAAAEEQESYERFTREMERPDSDY
jgi:hypothetical protein